jgi:hypothetical protein
MRSVYSGWKTEQGRNPGRSWLAETGKQAERERLTCSSRLRQTSRQQAGTGHRVRQAKQEAKLPDGGCV